jgi:hypothetical protein
MADFEQFWLIICDKMVLPEVAKDIMQEAWNQVNANVQAQAQAQAQAPPQQRRTRPLSGYNLFMKDQLLTMNTNCDLSGSERMKEVGLRWRALTPEQQNVWNDKALELVPPSSPKPASSSPPPQPEPRVHRVPTGYNLFLRDKMPDFKDRKVPAQQRMRQIGELWGKLTEQEKKEWNDKAKEEVSHPESS